MHLDYPSTNHCLLFHFHFSRKVSNKFRVFLLIPWFQPALISYIVDVMISYSYPLTDPHCHLHHRYQYITITSFHTCARQQRLALALQSYPPTALSRSGQNPRVLAMGCVLLFIVFVFGIIDIFVFVYAIVICKPGW